MAGTPEAEPEHHLGVMFILPPTVGSLRHELPMPLSYLCQGMIVFKN